MNVLSLFDGISCGQIAFERLGIKFNEADTHTHTHTHTITLQVR